MSTVLMGEVGHRKFRSNATTNTDAAEYEAAGDTEIGSRTPPR
ncbi:hypothetical protein [Lewinella sp. JB7]|nr:hypothetical protein [Lewinella sp. JB7]